jgi:hypothetical protein
MKIQRPGPLSSGQGPSEWFTGRGRIDLLFPVEAPSRMARNLVTFEPGARTARHTHPPDQTLIITHGCGWAQRESGPVEEIWTCCGLVESGLTGRLPFELGGADEAQRRVAPNGIVEAVDVAAD